MGRVMMKDLSDQLTEEEKKEIDEAYKKEIQYDDDCPEMTDEMLKEFHRFDEVNVPVSASSRKKLQSFGPQYRRILGKLIDLALNDNQLVKEAQAAGDNHRLGKA